MRMVIVAACALVLAGCANAYTKFYRPLRSNSAARIAAIRVSPPPSQPELDYWGRTPSEAYTQYGKLGYIPIGFSSFNAGAGVQEKQALAQGKEVGADLVVIVNPAYTGTRSSILPLVTPNTSTSTTNGMATAYGSGGSATVYGSATTTTYGTTTTYVPVSTDRYNYGAIYMVKIHSPFGVLFRDIHDDERQEINSNRGVFVITVITGTPAFNADIFPGDIITNINGERMTPELLRLRVEENRGKPITVGIHRAGVDTTKNVVLTQ